MWPATPLLMLVALASAASASNSAFIWVPHCSGNNASWTALGKYFKSVKGLDGVSLITYQLKADGTLGLSGGGDTPAGCGELHEATAWPVLHAMGIKNTPLVHCEKPGLETARNMMNDDAKRARFIQDAVNKMKAQSYGGYNLDMEYGYWDGTDADGKMYKKFVNEFAQALHAAGGTLTNDFMQCLDEGHKDFFQVSCVDYRQTSVDRVYSMKSYEHNLDTFKKVVRDGVAGLGNDYACGVDNSAPNPAEEFEYLSEKQVSQVAIWKCESPGCLSAEFEAALAKWHSQGTTTVV